MKCERGHEMTEVIDRDDPKDNYWLCEGCIESTCDRCGEFHDENGFGGILGVMVISKNE